MKKDKKKLLIVFHKAPYLGFNSQEGLETLLLASSYQYDITVLFLGKAVLQLVKNQNGALIQRKNIAKMLAALPLFEINKIYIEHKALYHYGLSHVELVLSYSLADSSKIKALLHSHNIIMNF